MNDTAEATKPRINSVAAAIIGREITTRQWSESARQDTATDWMESITPAQAIHPTA